MPNEIHCACHTCTSLDYLLADGVHAWCRRHQQVNSEPLTGCAYWMRSRNAELMAVPEPSTLNVADTDRLKNEGLRISELHGARPRPAVLFTTAASGN